MMLYICKIIVTFLLYSDVYPISFFDTLYDEKSITAHYNPVAEKLINELKEKGFIYKSALYM